MATTHLELVLIDTDLPGDPPSDNVDNVNLNLDDYDAFVQLSVIDQGLSTPPATPSEGDRYLLPSSGLSGVWIGQEGDVTYWNGTAWIYRTPEVGWNAWVEDEGVWIVYDGTTWTEVGEGAGGGSPEGVYIQKSADESLSLNDTPQADDELTFGIDAGSKWSFQAVLYYDPSPMGIKIQMVFDQTGEVINWAILTADQSVAQDEESDTTTITGDGDRKLTIIGTVDAAAATVNGNVTVYWSQSSSEATTCTVYKGSFIRAFKIPA